jgi:class 3 adenylate cyclase
MSAEVKKGIKLEIGHVLFIDVVGYSTLLINEQSELLQQLNEIVRGSKQIRAAQSEGKLIWLPAGDGMALVFRNSPEAPAYCALEISQALKGHAELPLRMGIHSGPIKEVADVTERPNVTGAGINIAQRVMDCGDAGHILLSKRVADDLAQYRQWQPHLHEVGECEVKHGARIHLVNLYTEELGNPQLPEKLKQAQVGQAAIAAASRPSPMLGRKHVLIAIGALLIAACGVGAWFYSRPRTIRSSLLEKSVAVLPFENLSSDKENAYFADGI